MTLDEIRKVINESLPFSEKQIESELLECLKCCNEENNRRLTLICQIASMRGMHKHLNKILDISLIYLKQTTDEYQISNVHFVLTTIYYLLNFPPKVVEHGEKYIALNTKNYTQLMLVFNYLTYIYKQYGYYNKAIEYNYKAYDNAILTGNVDLVAIGMITHLNNMAVYMSLKDNEKVEEEYNKYLELRNNNPDNPYLVMFSFSFETTDIFRDLYYDMSVENINKYIKQMRKVDNQQMMNNIDSVDSHLEVVKEMFNLEMYEECIDMCNIILKNKFIGDMNEINHYLLKCYLVLHKTETEEFKKIENNYITNLQSLESNYYSFINHLIDEQLNYIKYMSDYENIKKNYEKDVLTSCLNRPAFEQSVEKFRLDNPNGCLVFVDLDYLKKINDKYGHRTGDEYLKAFVNEFNKKIDQDKMILYRFAGDEFIVLSKESLEKTNDIFLDIYNVFISEVRLLDTDTFVSFSFGVKDFNNNKSIDEIIHQADRIMYEQKKKHHNMRK